MSQWRDHPGGLVLYTHAGQDATSVFAGFHGSGAYDTMAQFYIGDCKETLALENDFEKEIRALGPEMKRRGMYDARWGSAVCCLRAARAACGWIVGQARPRTYARTLCAVQSVIAMPHTLPTPYSLPYYAAKFASTTAIGLLAAAIAFQWRTTWGAVVAGLVMGVFFQQCGWLAHDFAHHQVFKTRAFNDYATMVIGSYVGFSLGWWKNKHNTHHAIPNVHESAYDAHDGDPDIDTLPFLAWSRKLLRKATDGGASDSPLSRFFVSRQAFIFFPLLLMARLTWALQSLAFVFRWTGLYWGAQVRACGCGKRGEEDEERRSVW